MENWISCEEGDLIEAALLLAKEHKGVTLPYNEHYGCYIHFLSGSVCELEDGVDVDDNERVYTFRYGDTPFNGMSMTADRVFRMVRLIPTIEREVPWGNLEGMGGIRGVLDAYWTVWAVEDYARGFLVSGTSVVQ